MPDLVPDTFPDALAAPPLWLPPELRPLPDSVAELARPLVELPAWPARPADTAPSPLAAYQRCAERVEAGAKRAAVFLDMEAASNVLGVPAPPGMIAENSGEHPAVIAVERFPSGDCAWEFYMPATGTYIAALSPTGTAIADPRAARKAVDGAVDWLGMVVALNRSEVEHLARRYNWTRRELCRRGIESETPVSRGATEAFGRALAELVLGQAPAQPLPAIAATISAIGCAGTLNPCGAAAFALHGLAVAQARRGVAQVPKVASALVGILSGILSAHSQDGE